MEKFSFFLLSPANRPFFYLLLLADLILRGIALYKSARKEQKVWFVALLVINSMGLLPLAYLILDKRASQPVKKVSVKKTTKRRRK